MRNYIYEMKVISTFEEIKKKTLWLTKETERLEKEKWETRKEILVQMGKCRQMNETKQLTFYAKSSLK